MVDTFLIKIPQQGMCLINIFTIHVPQFFNHQYIEKTRKRKIKVIVSRYFLRYLQTLKRATRPVARFSSLRFLNGTIRFVNGAVRFVNGSVRFVNGTVCFLHGKLCLK